MKSRVGFSCFHPLSVREAKVERLVGDKASEQEVGVVVEGVVRLVLAQPEEHLVRVTFGLGLGFGFGFGLGLGLDLGLGLGFGKG